MAARRCWLEDDLGPPRRCRIRADADVVALAPGLGWSGVAVVRLELDQERVQVLRRVRGRDVEVFGVGEGSGEEGRERPVGRFDDVLVSGEGQRDRRGTRRWELARGRY
jgi:hypothetical protein